MDHNINPKIAVLLAAYNGSEWISEQINTILNQVGVDITLFISVDASSDGTEILVDKIKSRDERVIILQHGFCFGGAGPNFYRLIQDLDFTFFDYIAFSDQDDIWLPHKLDTAIKAMSTNNAEGYSSNILSFWSNGKEKLINKSQSQRKLDYIFSSPGPGSTIVVTRQLINKVKLNLLSNLSQARTVEYHDWLIYAICRSYGDRWFIDSRYFVKYRQHQNNLFGVNSGFKAKWFRFKKIKNGWYRREVLKILQVCIKISKDPLLEYINEILVSPKKIRSNFKLLRVIFVSRRSTFDGLVLGLAVLCFFF